MIYTKLQPKLWKLNHNYETNRINILSNLKVWNCVLLYIPKTFNSKYNWLLKCNFGVILVLLRITDSWLFLINQIKRVRCVFFYFWYCLILFKFGIWWSLLCALILRFCDILKIIACMKPRLFSWVLWKCFSFQTFFLQMNSIFKSQDIFSQS